MTHALTTTLTLLIVAEGQQLRLHPEDHGFEHDVHHVINHLTDLGQWQDERKADLYARIVESVTAGMKFADMEKAIDRCLLGNVARWGHV